MNKADLVTAVAQKTELTKRDSELALNAVIETISGALARGNKVSLVGFGTFEVRRRAARTGRNPQTGKEIAIAATRVPVFRAGKSLKAGVAR